MSPEELAERARRAAAEIEAGTPPRAGEALRWLLARAYIQGWNESREDAAARMRALWPDPTLPVIDLPALLKRQAD